SRPGIGTQRTGVTPARDGLAGGSCEVHVPPREAAALDKGPPEVGAALRKRGAEGRVTGRVQLLDAAAHVLTRIAVEVEICPRRRDSNRTDRESDTGNRWWRLEADPPEQSRIAVLAVLLERRLKDEELACRGVRENVDVELSR